MSASAPYAMPPHVLRDLQAKVSQDVGETVRRNMQLCDRATERFVIVIQGAVAAAACATGAAQGVLGTIGARMTDEEIADWVLERIRVGLMATLKATAKNEQAKAEAQDRETRN